VLNVNEIGQPDGSFDLDVGALNDLCPGEPLHGDPSLSYSCTGFLVAPDLLVTAGHCLYAVNTPDHRLRHETELACKTFDWLFDYAAPRGGPAQTKGISSSALYHCREIIFAVQRESAPYSDYALVRLDRPVADRTPFRLGTGAVTGDLAMLGYPLGTPVKYTDNGHVLRDDPTRSSFITTLDAFEGNSGSPVLNAAHEVVGILVGGTPVPFSYSDRRLACSRLNRCDEAARTCTVPDADTSLFSGFQTTGSEVQRIQPVIDLIKARALLAR
jgi:hypothetical protein